MNIQGIDPDGYAFSRSPIILRETWPPEAFDKSGGSFWVELGGLRIYEGRFFPPLEIDLSEVLDAAVSFFPEPPSSSTDPIIEIEDTNAISRRMCHFGFDYDRLESKSGFTVIPGGVSKQNFRQLVSIGQNPFTTRFLNYRNNFFFTTRTASWRVLIRETELYPLYFLVDQQMATLEIAETVTHTTLTFGPLGPGVFALDIDALRRKFMDEHHIIPNVFDVYVAGLFSCRIVVEKSDISKERYRLKFRNSLGVFEIIELTGELTISPEYSETGDSSFRRYDSFTGGFYTDRERVERKQCVTVETGVKRPAEVRFLMDMIGSEEVYLLDLTPTPLKVIPSVENFTYRPRPDTPEKFTLKLEIADSETNIMQEIADGSEGRKPRVFSKQFSKQFN